MSIFVPYNFTPYFSWPITITTSVNDQIVVNEGAGDVTVTLTQGTYYLGFSTANEDDLCGHIANLLNNDGSLNLAYAVYVDPETTRVKIISSDATTIKWSTNARTQGLAFALGAQRVDTSSREDHVCEYHPPDGIYMPGRGFAIHIPAQPRTAASMAMAYDGSTQTAYVDQQIERLAIGFENIAARARPDADAFRAYATKGNAFYLVDQRPFLLNQDYEYIMKFAASGSTGTTTKTTAVTNRTGATKIEFDPQSSPDLAMVIGNKADVPDAHTGRYRALTATDVSGSTSSVSYLALDAGNNDPAEGYHAYLFHASKQWTFAPESISRPPAFRHAERPNFFGIDMVLHRAL